MNTTWKISLNAADNYDFYGNERDELNRSTYRPTERKKVLEKIEICQVDYNGQYVKFRILSRYNSLNQDTYRRYTDFSKLHAFLLHTYANYAKTTRVIILPKLPDKHSLQDQLKEFDEYCRNQFWQQRKEDLEIYLNMLAEIEEIRTSEVFQVFLKDAKMEELERQMENINISFPTTKPEKVINAVKLTFNSLYRYYQNWRTPLLEIPTDLSNKINKISQIRSVLVELLENERQRMRSVATQDTQLKKALKCMSSELTIMNNIKNKLIQSKAVDDKECPQLEESLSKLSDLMEGRLRLQLKNIESTIEIKNDIKQAIAMCDAVLSHIGHICESRPTNSLAIFKQFDGAINLQAIQTKAQHTLKIYANYYKRINNLVEV